MPGIRSGGSVPWMFTMISSPAPLLTSYTRPQNDCEAVRAPVGGCCAAKPVCPLRGRFQPRCPHGAGELFGQPKLWQSGIVNFPQPATWNSWKDGLSLLLLALAGLNFLLRCPAAAQECWGPQATALLPQAWDLNSVSFVRKKKTLSFLLRDEINYNALKMEVIIHNSCLVSTHCLKLILISSVFPSVCHFTSHCEKLCFLMSQMWWHPPLPENVIDKMCQKHGYCLFVNRILLLKVLSVLRGLG